MTERRSGSGTRQEAAAEPRRPLGLTKREREILGLLADGLSGAQIAERLVVSPETVRTHVRNAMAKLGAATRSQAVVMALRSEGLARGAAEPAPAEPARPAAPAGGAEQRRALEEMLRGLVSLYDVEAAAVFLVEADGLSLRSAAEVGSLPAALGASGPVPFGEGIVGRTALERRVQVARSPGGGGLVAAPINGGGRLVGVIALAARVSRPVGRSELLLLQALANRVGEVLLAGAEIGPRLSRAMERFGSSWTAATRVV